MAEFDFASVQVQEAELPEVTRGRKRKIEDNPFIGPVGESYNDGKGRAIKVPNEQVQTAERLIRQAATDLGVGVRVVISLTKEEREKASKQKQVTIQFQGQEKRKRRTKAQLEADNASEVAQAEPSQG